MSQQQQQQHASLVVAFVIDTSASMAENTSDGRSLLDHAKDMVEQLTVKSRHTPAHHVLLTNCFLLTTEEWPANVKTSWADWGDKPEKRLARFVLAKNFAWKKCGQYCTESVPPDTRPRRICVMFADSSGGVCVPAGTKISIEAEDRECFLAALLSFTTCGAMVYLVSMRHGCELYRPKDAEPFTADVTTPSCQEIKAEMICVLVLNQGHFTKAGAAHTHAS